MRTSITTGFIIYFHFRFFVDIIEVLIPLHYISLTEIYLMICNEGIWILLSLEENRNIIFFFCRILGLLLVSHPSGRGCKTFHKWYRFWFEGMIESLTATALFSSYISSSYCGLGAVKVRSGRFIGCFHNVISIFRLIPEVKTSEWHRINYGQNGNRWISKAKS